MSLLQRYNNSIFNQILTMMKFSNNPIKLCFFLVAATVNVQPKRVQPLPSVHPAEISTRQRADQQLPHTSGCQVPPTSVLRYHLGPVETVDPHAPEQPEDAGGDVLFPPDAATGHRHRQLSRHSTRCQVRLRQASPIEVLPLGNHLRTGRFLSAERHRQSEQQAVSVARKCGLRVRCPIPMSAKIVESHSHE
jgi:hypothetical protein